MRHVRRAPLQAQPQFPAWPHLLVELVAVDPQRLVQVQGHPAGRRFAHPDDRDVGRVHHGQLDLRQHPPKRQRGKKSGAPAANHDRAANRLRHLDPYTLTASATAGSMPGVGGGCQKQVSREHRTRQARGWRDGYPRGGRQRRGDRVAYPLLEPPPGLRRRRTATTAARPRLRLRRCARRRSRADRAAPFRCRRPSTGPRLGVARAYARARRARPRRCSRPASRA